VNDRAGHLHLYDSRSSTIMTSWQHPSPPLVAAQVPRLQYTSHCCYVVAISSSPPMARERPYIARALGFQ